MSLKKGLVLGMVLVLAISWASSALAMSLFMSIEQNYSFNNARVQGTHSSPLGGTLSCNLQFDGDGISYQPTTVGPFSQQIYVAGHCDLSWDRLGGMSGIPYTPPLPDTIGVGCTPWVYITYSLDLTEGAPWFSKGPWGFSEASWTATVIVRVTETPVFHLSYPDVHYFDPEAGGGTTVLGCLNIGGDFPTFGLELFDDFYELFAGGSIDFSVRLEVAGNVIDTTAPVPLPSTLLLLGSGLGGLAFYERRKVVGCR
jgi:hypothetical protein